MEITPSHETLLIDGKPILQDYVNEYLNCIKQNGFQGDFEIKIGNSKNETPINPELVTSIENKVMVNVPTVVHEYEDLVELVSKCYDNQEKVEPVFHQQKNIQTPQENPSFTYENFKVGYLQAKENEKAKKTSQLTSKIVNGKQLKLDNKGLIVKKSLANNKKRLLSSNQIYRNESNQRFNKLNRHEVQFQSSQLNISSQKTSSGLQMQSTLYNSYKPTQLYQINSTSVSRKGPRNGDINCDGRLSPEHKSQIIAYNDSTPILSKTILNLNTQSQFLLSSKKEKQDQSHQLITHTQKIFDKAQINLKTRSKERLKQETKFGFLDESAYSELPVTAFDSDASKRVSTAQIRPQQKNLDINGVVSCKSNIQTRSMLDSSLSKSSGLNYQQKSHMMSMLSQAKQTMNFQYKRLVAQERPFSINLRDQGGKNRGYSAKTKPESDFDIHVSAQDLENELQDVTEIPLKTKESQKVDTNIKLDGAYGVYFIKNKRTIRRTSEKRQMGKLDVFKEIFVNKNSSIQSLSLFEQQKTQQDRKISKNQQEAIFAMQQQIYNAVSNQKQQQKPEWLNQAVNTQQLKLSSANKSTSLKKILDTSRMQFQAAEQARFLEQIGIKEYEIKDDKNLQTDNIPKSRIKFHQREQQFNKMYEQVLQQWRQNDNTEDFLDDLIIQDQLKPDTSLYKERLDNYPIIGNPILMRGLQKTRKYINPNNFELLKKTFDPMNIKLRVMPIS